MHIVEFLRHLRARVDIEIIIAALPEAAVFAGTLWKTKGQLARALAFFGAQCAGDALLETLDDLGGSGGAGLAQEQVHMLGHEDVANESKAVTHSCLLKGANSQIARANGVQERPSLIAAKGDEMQIAETGDAV